MAIVWQEQFNYPNGALPITTGSVQRLWMPKARWQMDENPNSGYDDFAGISYNRNPNGGDPTPFTVQNSILRVEMRRANNRWEGGYLVTNPLSPGRTFGYGYYEWRARLPQPQQGMFPALWMFTPTYSGSSTPANKNRGEIDAFEIFGHALGRPWQSTIHNKSDANPSGPQSNSPTFNEDTSGWHRYGVEWTSTAIRVYYDGNLRHTYTGSLVTWFQGLELDLRINYSMNPNWLSGSQHHNQASINNAPFYLEVDYVRVYSSRTGNATTTGPEDPESAVMSYDPADLTVEPEGSGLRLNWSPSPTQGVTSYGIHRRTPPTGNPFDPETNTPIATVSGTTYLDPNRPQGTQFEYQAFGLIGVPDDDDGDDDRTNPVDPATATHVIPSSMATADGNGNMSAVQPGDVVALQSGTRGRITIQNFYGTEENPITFVNQNGNLVNIQVTSTSHNAIEIIDCRNIRITGSGASGGVGRTVGSKSYQPGMTFSALEGMQNAGIRLSGGERGIRFKKHDWAFALPAGQHRLGFEFDHIEIHNISKNGLHGWENSDDAGPNYTFTDMRFHHLYIHDTDARGGDGEGMYIGSNTSGYGTKSKAGNVEVDHNFIIRTGYDSFQFGTIHAGWGLHLHHNVCVDAGRYSIPFSQSQRDNLQAMTNLFLQAGTWGRVHSNYFFDAGQVSVWDAGVGGTQYYNNVCVRPGIYQNSARGFRIGSNRNLSPSNERPSEAGARLWNNTIVDVPLGAIHFTNDQQSNQNEARNNVMRNTGGVTVSSSDSATTSHNLTSNPSFVNHNGDDYRVNSGSAAINAGTNLSSRFTVDILGVSRPQGAGWDIGAYERPAT